VITHGLFDSSYFKNDLAIIFWLLIWLTTLRQTEAKHG